jgi:PleD family two-component response regulator
MELARQLEGLFGSILQPQQAVLLESLISALQREVQNTPIIQQFQRASDPTQPLQISTEMAAKVMIVDDDQQWLQTLPMLLNPWGFKVTTLAETQHFWAVLQAVIPDILVLDVNMPQMNGLELCQVLRSNQRWQRLPVLFLSVLSDLGTQNQAFLVGADDYLCKPVLGIDLANRILNRLQRVRSWAS